MTGRRLRRTALAGGLAALALAGHAVSAAGAARAAPASAPARGAPVTAPAPEDSGPLTVTLAGVTPSALRPSTPLTVTGTVRNSGARPLTDLRLTLRMTTETLATQAEVTRWADGDATAWSSPIGDATRLERPLAPGRTASFSVRVPAGTLQLDPAADRPDPRGLEVRAEGRVDRPAPGDPASAEAAARSFAVWQPQPSAQPLQLSLLAPVTDPVAAAEAGSPTARPAAAWSPSGRLTRLLRATADSGFSYAVDPALLTAATTTSQPGASGPAPSASPTGAAGTGGAAQVAPGSSAAAWLQLFTTVSRRHDLVALPWADPDVVAVARGNGTDLLDLAEAQARATVRTVLQRDRDVDTVVWPARGRADTGALYGLARRPGRSVVLDGVAVRARTPDQGARLDLGLAPGGRPQRVSRTVVSDPALSALVARGDAAAVPQVLALLAVTAAAAPGQTVLVTLPRDWDPEPAAVGRLTAALRGADWVGVRPFSGLARAAAPGGTRPLSVGYGTADRRRELPAAHVSAVAVAQRRLTAFAPALVEPDRVVTPLRLQALSLVGLGWRGTPTGDLAVARTPLTAGTDALYAGISIDPGSTKNLLAKEGSLPISVRNTLRHDVKVLLVLIPRTGQLAIPDAYQLRLGAGTSQQVPVPVKAVANGDVFVVASFRTPDDRTLLYQSRDIQVRVRSDWEGRGVLVIALLLGLLLAVGLARGVRRGRTRIPPEAVPDPDDVGRVLVPDDDGEPDPAGPDGDGPVPTTAVPTTAVPTTAVPTTAVPTTAVPTTAVPTTAVPTTVQATPAARPAGPLPARHARRSGPAGAAPAVADDPQEEATLAAVPASAAPTASTLAAAAGARPVVTATLPAGAGATTVTRDRPGTPDEPPAGAVLTSPAPVATAAPADGDPRGPGDRGPGDPLNGAGGPGSGTDHDGSVEAAGNAGTGAGEASTRGILGSSAVMAAGTLMSRILGMLRVVVLAWAIGAAFSANAFSTANTLPNSLFLLIGGGVLNAVLVPQIVRAMQQPDGGQAYVDRLLTLSLAVLAAATVVVTAAAPLLLRLYVDSSWSSVDVGVGVAFAFWCLPQVFFYGLYTVLGQVLNARGSYGPYMWAPVVNNVVAIAGMVVFVVLYGSGTRPAGWWTAGAIAVLAGTTTLGVVAQALVLVPVLRRTGFRWRLRWGVRGVGLRSAGEAAGWTFGALAVGQLGLVLLSRIANDAGQEAGEAGTGRFVYDTAFLLFMLPHSLVAVSVVTAVFTRMSHAVVTGRLADVRADLSVALRTTGVATVPATVAFAVLGPDLTALLFATNNRATTEGLAWTTTAMVVGLVAFSAQYLFQRVFYAFSDARTPFFVQVLVVAVWSVGNVVAGRRLEGVEVVVGIAASMSAANVLGAAVTLVLVRRRLGGVDGRRVGSLYARCLIAVAPAGVLGWATSAAAHLFAGEGTRGALLALLSGSTVLLLVYLAGLKLLRVRELDDLAAPVRRLVRL